jgi:hypothetical protein
LPTERKFLTPGWFMSVVAYTFSAMCFICSSVAASIDSTSWMASTGLPSRFGSSRAIRLAPLIAEASLTTLTIGTGQKRPPVVFMFFATDSESLRVMKPVSGLKYPHPSMTALAAAWEETCSLGRPSASLSSWARFASSAT